MKTKTLPHPSVSEEWRESFRNHTMRVGFILSLSKAMLEFLCAVADDVQWDRGIYRTMHCPDNWIGAERALEKRGLIRRKTADERKTPRPENWDEESCCTLTPAGRVVIQLLKIAGLFVEQDAAITKKFRSKRA